MILCQSRRLLLAPLAMRSRRPRCRCHCCRCRYRRHRRRSRLCSNRQIRSRCCRGPCCPGCRPRRQRCRLRSLTLRVRHFPCRSQRLALDALGGEAGKRLAIALRPGGTLVMHQMQSGQVPEPPTLAEGLAYVSLQELATRISHFNTGNMLEDEAGQAVMRRVAKDENLHYLFYRDAMTAIFEHDPSTAVLAVEKQVRDFRMLNIGEDQIGEEAAIAAPVCEELAGARVRGTRACGAKCPIL